MSSKVVARKGEELIVLTKNGRSYRGFVTMDLQNDNLNHLYLEVGEAQHVFHISDVKGIKRI